jgi:hypothetical protein
MDAEIAALAAAMALGLAALAAVLALIPAGTP